MNPHETSVRRHITSWQGSLSNDTLVGSAYAVSFKKHFKS